MVGNLEIGKYTLKNTPYGYEVMIGESVIGSLDVTESRKLTEGMIDELFYPEDEDDEEWVLD